MVSNINMVPETINQFRVYKNGSVLIGISGEVTLPDLKAIKATIEGPGILGQIDSACIGHFEAMELVIPYTTVNQTVNNFNPFENQEFCLRGAIQCTDPNAKTSFVPMRVVVRGKATDITPGKLKQTEAMDTKIAIQTTYYKIEIDGKTVIELDKWNSVYIVDGQDILADVRRMC